VVVRRNDAVTLDEIASLQPDHIVISPGPCTPNEAGLSCDIIKTFGPRIPLLGVCLGHQAIGQVYGGRVIRAPEPMHGKTSVIQHQGQGVFQGLSDPLEAIRYHSLIVERATFPAELEITAQTADGLIMGLRHKVHPIEGVQFHPESIMTSVGKPLLQNFLQSRHPLLVGSQQAQQRSA
jgi:anthranilate synthase/aminodeoxychorismate synthase-like glutamine amidotransferase